MGIDFFSLALSKQYTEDTSDALGAVKGTPCTIKSIEKTETGSLITFEWTGTSGKTETSTLSIKDGVDGTNGLDGRDGSDGKDGTNGVGISKVEKINTVSLVDTYRITFTNGSTFEYEVTNGADGKDGTGTGTGSGDENVIESISVNGTALEVKNKNVDIPIPSTDGLITEETLNDSLKDYAKKENIPTTLPASDVHEWAKTETKPEYTADEVGAISNSKQFEYDNAVEKAHIHENKEVLDGITLEKIAEWDNKSEFDGSYHSLTDTPTEFKTVNGHTVESDVPENAVFTDTVYDDSAISGRLSAIENAYLPKNEIESSIETAKQEAITAILGGTVEEDFDTLKEVATWILADQTNSAELISRVTEIEKHYLKGTDKSELQQMINNLQAFVGELPSTATSTTVVAYIQEVIDALHIGNYALASDLVALAQRVTTLETNIKNKVDKIEGKGLSTNDYDNTEKSTVAQNKSDIAELNEKVGLLDVQTTTSTTLYNSKESSLELVSLTGNVQQKQYNGYQKFDASKLPTTTAGGATVTNNEDGSFTISGSGELTSDLNLLKNYTHEETIALFKSGSIAFNSVTNTYPYILWRLYVNEEVKLRLDNLNTNEEKGEILQEWLDNDTCYVRLAFYGALNSTIIPGTIKPMLYQDGDGTWEPFVGGKKSPSPEYKQSLNNTLDCVEMQQGYWGASIILCSANNRICSKYKVPCKSGDTVKIVSEKSFTGNILFLKDEIYLTSKNYDNTTPAIVPDGATSFLFNCYDSTGNITPETAGKIQLTVNNKYVGQIVKSGKNRLSHFSDKSIPVNDVTCHIKDDVYNFSGSATKAGGRLTYVDYITLSQGTYTFSKQNVTGICGIPCLTQIGTNTVFVLNNGVSHTFTVNEETKYGLGFNYVTGVTYNGSLNIQLEESPKMTTYEPPVERISTFFTEKPLMANDQIVNLDGMWHEKHVMNEVVFDGSDDENWILNTNGSEYVTFYIKKIDKKEINSAYCDKFLISTAYEFYNGTDGECLGLTKAYPLCIYICILKSRLSSIDAATFKLWLSENPITVQYELAEPTYTILDQESQDSLNSLKSFDTITYIEVDSRIKPSEIKTKYATSEVGARVLDHTTLLSQISEDVNVLEASMNEHEGKINDIQNTLDDLGDLATKDVVSESDLDSELLLKVNDICTTTESTLYNSKAGGAKLNHLIGATEQATYPGYQLFDSSKLPTTSAGGATVTNNGDGSFTVSGSGELTSNFKINYDLTHEETIKLFKPGTLTINAQSLNPYFFVDFLSQNGTKIRGVTAGTPLNVTQDILDTEGVFARIGFFSGSGLTITPGTIRPMLYQDGDGTWEPFTGGQPSPNPEYPQSLNNTGDCVEMINGVYSPTNGAWGSNAQALCNKYRIPCKTGDVIKLFNENMPKIAVICYYDEDNNFISYKQNTYTTNEVEFTVKVNNACYFNFHNLYNTSNEASIAGKIQLTVNGKYVGQIVETGKNLFVKSLAKDGYGISNVGVLYAKEEYSCYEEYIEITANEKYVSSNIAWYNLYDSNKQHITAGNNNPLIVPTNAKYVRLTVHTNKKDIAQFEKGDVATEYQEGYKKIHTYYTSQPMMAGDSIVQVDGKWCEKHVMREVVFDGSGV